MCVCGVCMVCVVCGVRAGKRVEEGATRGWGGGRDGRRDDGRRLDRCRECTRTFSGCGNGRRGDCSFSRLKKEVEAVAGQGRGPILDGARDWLREKKEDFFFLFSVPKCNAQRKTFAGSSVR